MSEYILRSARYVAREYMEKMLREGSVAVDATMGNGHDTEALAQLVGQSGHVYAFDVQEAAVQATGERLAQAGLKDRVTLFHASHARMKELVPCAPDLVVFNLGWLPGGDHGVTTRWETTKEAVEKALSLLLPGGVLVICAYPGHAEGDRERQELSSFLSALSNRTWNVLRQRFLNAGPGAPECFAVQKNP